MSAPEPRFPASWDEALEALLRGELGPVLLGPPVPIQPHPRTLAGHPVGQVRGVLAEEVVVSTPLDPFLPIKALVSYSGLSERKLRAYLNDPGHPLPHYRVGGKILVRRSEFDTWMTSYRRVGHADVDQIIAEVVRDLR